ncbi:MAG: hypothetical protein VXY91_02205 [Bacteroidota bacterium]|nr:hypothetical protein [Bacteroidota bacterium]
MKNLLIIWRGQIRAKGIQYVMLILLSILVCVGFYTARITEAYIFKKWTESAQFVDVIVGRKGSPLQIVINTLFRLENPTGNIPGSTVDFWENHPMISSSCPISLGDNIMGYPLIGTSQEYYNWMNVKLIRGTLPINHKDVVLDVKLADALELQIGDTLKSSHGASTGETHDHFLQITGLIQAKRAADQSCFFTTIDAYYEMHGTKHSKAITSLMLRLKSKSALVMLPRIFDNRPDEQGAFPVFIFAQLQKQWSPVLHDLENFSIIIPIALLFMFALVLFYLGSTERTTKRFMLIQKVNLTNVLIYCHGLALTAVLFGSLISFMILRSVFHFYIHNEKGLIYIPIFLSMAVYSIQSKRQ